MLVYFKGHCLETDIKLLWGLKQHHVVTVLKRLVDRH